MQIQFNQSKIKIKNKYKENCKNKDKDDLVAKSSVIGAKDKVQSESNCKDATYGKYKCRGLHVLLCFLCWTNLLPEYHHNTILIWLQLSGQYFSIVEPWRLPSKF